MLCVLLLRLDDRWLLHYSWLLLLALHFRISKSKYFEAESRFQEIIEHLVRHHAVFMKLTEIEHGRPLLAPNHRGHAFLIISIKRVLHKHIFAEITRQVNRALNIHSEVDFLID